MILDEKQLERYSRQIVLPILGINGQEKLLNSKVLVLGAGGLGSGVLMCLSGAGIGTIGIVDYDKVESSNLHRQIVHNTNDLGKSKVISAKEKISKINPDIKVFTYEAKLDKNNIKEIIKDFDVIVDGLDNFSDKFMVNDYCVRLNKKLVHGGVVGFEGQVLTVIPHKSSCLRCYFPDKEPDDLRQSCKETGVLPSCVGVISMFQANEVLKLILGIGEPLTNKVLKFNALDSKFYEFKIDNKNNDCPVCSVMKTYTLR